MHLKRLLNVLLSRAAVSLSSFFFSVLFSRLIIESHGFESYAVIALIASLPSLLPFADFGAGATLVNAGADLKTDRDPLNARSQIAAAFRILAISAGVLLTTGCILTFLDLWPLLLGDSIRAIDAYALGALVAIGAVSMSVVNATPARLLQGWQMNGLVYWISVGGPPLSLLMAWLWIEIGGPVGIIAGAPTLAASLVAFLFWIPGSRSYPGHLFRDLTGAAKVSRSEIMSTLRVGSSTLVITIGGVISFQADRVVLSHKSTTFELGAYSLVAPLYVAALGLLIAVGQNLWPKYRTLLAARAMTIASFNRDLILMATIGAIGAGALYVTAPILAVLIAGDIGSDVPRSLSGAFATLLLLQALHVPSGMLLTDDRGFRIQRNIVIPTTIVNVVITIALAGPFGAVGVVLGSIIGVTIQMPATYFFARREIRSRMAELEE